MIISIFTPLYLSDDEILNASITISSNSTTNVSMTTAATAAEKLL